jgi:F-type H+-transporting ATPase subunit delta
MPESFDQQLEVADVYAAALFALARDAGQIEAVRGELEELVRLAELQPVFAQFLSSGAVDDDDRTTSLDKMFRGKLSDIVLNTLHVMNEHGRAGMLRPLLRAFVQREEQAEGQVEVVATSAVELDDQQKNAVRQAAAELSGKKPLVEFVVDPAILGGLVLRIGDFRFDRSIRQILHGTKAHLLERSDRGLRIAAT